MPSFTKDAIKESFWKLLNEKPVDQITVKQIVENCGINRNSFYYHFEDIPSLLEEIVTEMADETIREYASVDTIDQCIDAMLKGAYENKRALKGARL